VPPDSRRFVLHALLALLPAALLLLWTCDFFTAWDGRAVSVRPAQGDAVTRAVLIAEADRTIERQWPSALVQELALPVDPLALAPEPVPPERPPTHKRRFTLSYEVQTGGAWRTVATTSPQALGLALLAWLGLVALRNMAVGGTPWSISPRDRYAVPVQDRAGQPTAPSSRRSSSKPGPPPPRPVRGRGRR
jgi:hypothetical protein